MRTLTDKGLRLSLELAGMGRDGVNFDASIPPLGQGVPGHIWLVEKGRAPHLAWEWIGPSGEAPRPGPDHREIALAFAGLAEAEPQTILEFARQYGVMLLCEHAEPCIHNHPLGAISLGSRLCAPTKREPLAVWKRYARELRAVLRMAAEARLGRPATSREDWEATGGLFERRLGRSTVSRTRQRVEAQVRRWLALGGVRPGLSWRSEKPELTFEGVGVLGAVIRHVLPLVAGEGGYAFCAACCRVFTPHRRPTQGQRSWCPSCGNRARWRQAKRDQRVRA